MLFLPNARGTQSLNCQHFMTAFNFKLVPPLTPTAESGTCSGLNPTALNPSSLSFTKNPDLSKGTCFLSTVRRLVVVTERVLPFYTDLVNLILLDYKFISSDL